jgi:serine/threonine protein kinase
MNSRKTRLVDFGICSELYDKHGKHVDEGNWTSFRGTLLFSSLHTMENKPMSRRDDLIQVVYMLVFLLGDLPFKAQANTYDDKFAQILAQKQTTSVEQLTRPGTNSQILRPFIQEVFSYQYSEEPYYSKLVHMLTKELLAIGSKPSSDIHYKREPKGI